MKDAIRKSWRLSNQVFLQPTASMSQIKEHCVVAKDDEEGLVCCCYPGLPLL